MFKTEEAKRFFAAWQGLRKGDQLPHYREVFQNLPNEWLPQVMIFEQIFEDAPGPGSGSGAEGAKQKEGAKIDKYILRFMGTRAVEYWNRDITGHDIFSLLAPKLAAAGRRNMATVLEHPCGLITIGVFTIASREELPIESVLVPTANDPGRPARILGFVQHLSAPFPVADDRHDTPERRWFDIGSGVPNRKPWS